MLSMLVRRKRCLLRIVLILLVLMMIFSPLGTLPVHAEGPGPVDCHGDLLCELGQVIQNVATTIITPLQQWARFTAYAGLYGVLYSFALTAAQIMWSIAKALITVGVQIEVLADWIISHFFQPMISMTGQTFKPIVGIFFFVAMVLLGISYVLAALVKLNVVSPRNMILWWIAGAFFFSTGTSLYASMRNLSQALNGVFYAAALSTINGSPSSGPNNPFGKMAADDSSSDTHMPTPCNNFSAYSPSAKLGGADIAMAYLTADGFDVLKNGKQCMGGSIPATMPRSWYLEGGYFDALAAPETWRIGDTECPTCLSLADQVDNQIKVMQQATNGGFSAVARLFQSVPLVWFAIVEQLISLCIIIAQGLTFISFACAILFAFFKRTEPVAWAIIDHWFALIIQAIVIALLQALVVALYIAAANTGSALITLGVSVVGLLVMGILLISGLKAVWNAFNRLFEAFGNATGNVIVSPGTMAGASANLALAAGGAMVGSVALLGTGIADGVGGLTGGYSALANGSTWAQAAGVAMGGTKALDGAAYVLTRLPGLRETSLGEAANQYIEGASVKAVGESITSAVPLTGSVVKRLAGPSVGSALLTDRNPQHEEAYLDEAGNQYWRRSMLRPNIGQLMENALVGPTWESGTAAKSGQGGSPLRGEAGDAFRRGDAPIDKLSGWGVDEKFTPVQSSINEGHPNNNSLPLNNDGNLDETIQQDMQRTLAANSNANQSEGSDGSGKAIEGAATRLEATAMRAGDALTRSAELLSRSVQAADTQKRFEQVEGRLTQNGSNNVGLVMSKAIDSLQQENAATGRIGTDNTGISAAMAGALDLTPVLRNGKTIDPIERDVPRFQMFADQALTMGLSGKAVEHIIQEVKSNPDGKLSPESRDSLIHHQHEVRGQSWQDSLASTQRLEHTARMLPSDISAYGSRQVPVNTATEMPVTGKEGYRE